ncbi:hypothetical protein BR10RB9215_C20874 [Brucella sp. 10RB9215]|uniref:hypothetical protein n=1 Tax=Brucella sp. 10RB9215 TaxID=1149953 RepID=UPI00090A9568|nr:hypothetical protein BR10RB9215_C20874 [Brucella sp. 10RB9215]
MPHRMDKFHRQMDSLDEDLAVLGGAVSLFVHFWLTTTPPVPDSGKAIPRASPKAAFGRHKQTSADR